MTNLLPPQGRKALVREYWTRVSATWLFLIVGALGLVGTLLYPTFQVIEAQLEVYAEAYDEVKGKADALTEIENELKKYEEIANLLIGTVSASTTPSSELFKTLDALSRSDVRLSQFSRNLNSEGEKTVTISGVANTRTALSDFRDRVRAHGYFKSADFSLSDIAQSSDINFTIQVVLNE